jgi:hypothetical protein
MEVEKAFYEAPPELIGREVWVRWDGRCVRIFNERMEQVGMHTRCEPGKFSHSLGRRRLQRSGAILVPLLGQPSGGPGRAMRPMGTEWPSMHAVPSRCARLWGSAV